MAKAVAINRSKIHESLVQSLSGENAIIYDESGKKLFPTIRELLTFAALLGLKHGKRTPIDKGHGIDDIQGTTYEDTEALEFIWMIAVIETGNAEILKDGNERQCAEIFEEYSNTGLKIISEYLDKIPHEEKIEKMIEEISKIALSN